MAQITDSDGFDFKPVKPSSLAKLRSIFPIVFLFLLCLLHFILKPDKCWHASMSIRDKNLKDKQADGMFETQIRLYDPPRTLLWMVHNWSVTH